MINRIETAKYYLFSQAVATLKAAGFDVKERLMGLCVVGLNCTADGVTYICAHDGTGWYLAERIAKVITRTAPIAK